MAAQPYSYLYFLLILLVAVSASAIPLNSHPGSVSGEKQIIDRPEIQTSPLQVHQGRASEDPESIITADDDTPKENTLIPRGDTDIPTPFDTSLGTNYTSKSCPKFFTKFLSDSSFQSCHALSLLLRNSNSFFYTLHSAPATSHLLDIACDASVSQCAHTLTLLAKNLIKDDNCGEEYKLGNPNVVDAYVDLITYEPIYRASCLKNPVSGDYCFVDAATNSTNPADYDTYFVPFGNVLEDHDEASWDNNTPTCNKCLQATMNVFAGFAQVDGQPLVESYLPSARVVNRHCGGGFAKMNITVGTEKAVVETSGGVVFGPGLVWLVSGVLALVLWG